MKILVTGSNGQLGRELRDVLEETTPGITDYTDITELDLTDAKAVADYVRRGDYSHIINCAAFTDVERAETDQRECYCGNVDAVQHLATAAAENSIRMLHISTDYVFDGSSCRPYREADKVNPISVYGTTKRKGEMVLLSLCPDSIVVRTGWLYSPFGRNFVKTMLRLGTTSKSLRVVCDQIGTPTYAHDLAIAIRTIVFSPQWVPGIYHFSDEGACSWYDFAETIFHECGITECSVTPVSTADYPTAATRPPFAVLDKNLIKRTYNIHIPHWAESLRHCLKRMESIGEMPGK